ncbi:hypothetical protein NSA50_19535 [Clostridium sp. DSM 100503]|uniref:hypothetical protein n=1 Tax=Clostridium sp. DSM 100503 TaxID=2963282 RepID=UPI00214A5C39|nr:hypothetical protein [Clostridium sp. DSM 100503]MCR1953181.1 hypothetical protein [Clostridium sp. DSM 100503]
MTKKELMIKAHQMTKEIKNEYQEVDYKFQLGLCLAYLQSEGEVEMAVEEKLQNLGYKVWSKNDSEGNVIAKRIYVNNLMELAEKLNIELLNPKALRKNSMYFDCMTEKFCFNVTSSRVAIVERMIEELRK